MQFYSCEVEDDVVLLTLFSIELGFSFHFKVTKVTKWHILKLSFLQTVLKFRFKDVVGRLPAVHMLEF